MVKSTSCTKISRSKVPAPVLWSKVPFALTFLEQKYQHHIYLWSKVPVVLTFPDQKYQHQFCGQKYQLHQHQKYQMCGSKSSCTSIFQLNRILAFHFLLQLHQSMTDPAADLRLSQAQEKEQKFPVKSTNTKVPVLDHQSTTRVPVPDQQSTKVPVPKHCSFSSRSHIPAKPSWRQSYIKECCIRFSQFHWILGIALFSPHSAFNKWKHWLDLVVIGCRQHQWQL